MADFGDVAERLRRSTVEIQSGGGQRGGGSGVILEPAGAIVTNAHVARSPEVSVRLWDRRQFSGKVIRRDMRRDLALVSIEAASLPAASIRDSSSLRIGELVIAVGNPLGFTGALSTGIVHGFGSFPALGRQPWVQADVRLAPGNSGGPLADASGQVVGINTMIAGGLSLAIPSNVVVEFQQSRTAGRQLGVVVRPITNRGLLVLEIQPGTAAEAASLLPGDLLVAGGGRRFNSVDDLADVLDSPLDSLRLEFFRNGHPSLRQVTARLAPSEARM